MAFGSIMSLFPSDGGYTFCVYTSGSELVLSIALHDDIDYVISTNLVHIKRL